MGCTNYDTQEDVPKIKENLVGKSIKKFQYKESLIIKDNNDDNDNPKDINNIVIKESKRYGVHSVFDQESQSTIVMIIKIEKDEKDSDDYLDKEIFFLDNMDEVENGVKNFHDNLGELDDYNVDLYINNLKYPFKKSFKFESEGEYKITLKLKTQMEN